MPKRHARPFHFNHMGSSLNWGTKRGLRRLPLVTDPLTGKPVTGEDGRVTIIWPSRKRGQRNSGLCKGCNRRVRVRYDSMAGAWKCRRCGASRTWITQLRGADNPGPMAIPTRLGNYLDQGRGASGLPAQEMLTPAQRRRLVHKARGRLEQYRGPHRPPGKHELAGASTATQRSHP